MKISYEAEGDYLEVIFEQEGRLLPRDVKVSGGEYPPFGCSSLPGRGTGSWAGDVRLCRVGFAHYPEPSNRRCRWLSPVMRNPDGGLDARTAYRATFVRHGTPPSHAAPTVSVRSRITSGAVRLGTDVAGWAYRWSQP